MAHLPLRPLELTSEDSATYEWLGELGAQLADPSRDRNELVRDNDLHNIPTVLEDGVRITYGAVVLAGVKVGVQGMVGARAVATRNVRPYQVNVGIPARSVRVKSIMPQGVADDVNRPDRDDA